MKSQLKPRPQSKGIKSNRPTSKHVSKQQAIELFQKGKAEQELKSYLKAIQFYRRATIYDPNYFQANCNMGSCYRALSKYPEARNEYKRAIQIKSDDAISHYNLANIFRIIGDEEKSIEHYLFVIKLKEDQHIDVGSLYLNSLINIGICYKNIGQYQQSMEFYSKVNEIDPNDQSGIFNHAMCLKAVLQKDNIIYFQEMSKVRVAKAQQLFKKAISLNPSNTVAKLALTDLYYLIDPSQSNIRKAVEGYREILTTSDSSVHEEVNKKLGYCLNLISQFQESAKHYQESLNAKAAQELKVSEQKKAQILRKAAENAKKADQIFKKQIKQNVYDVASNPPQKTASGTSPTKITAEIIPPIKISGETSPTKKQQNQNTLNIPEKLPQTKLQKKVSSIKEQQPSLTEADGLKLIASEDYQKLQKHLKRLADSSLVKNTLFLVMYAKKAKNEPKFYNVAYDVYKRYFFSGEPQQRVSLDKISLEGHKAITEILSGLKKHEEAINHYQYLSKFTKQKAESIQIHNTMGDSFDYLGDKQRALQQYKVALSYEPNNHILVYNVAVFLYESGLGEESLTHFRKFLLLIEKEQSMTQETKDQYIADCLVTMALCSEGRSDQQESFQKAETKINEIFSKKSGVQEKQMLQSNTLLNFYLRMADIYEQKISNSKNKLNEQYIAWKGKLQEAYLKLLDFQECPDRDAILNNLGSMYYGEGLYLNAICYHDEVSEEENIAYLNISLSYLHLQEHVMAVRYITEAFQRNRDDPIICFNHDVISWIYALNTKGKIYQLFPNMQEDTLLVRLEFGIAIIDKLSFKLENFTDELDAEILNQLIHQILSNEQIPLKTEGQNLKFKLIKEYLQKTNEITSTPQSHHISEDLLKLSLTKSKDVIGDTQKLLELLSLIPKCPKSISINQSLLSAFIFSNQLESSKICSFLKVKVNKKVQHLELKLDGLEELKEDIELKAINKFKNIGELILIIRDWESNIEDRIGVIIELIQVNYYKSNVRLPLEIQYKLPRHELIRQCDHTFMKLANFNSKYFKFSLKGNLKGTNIQEIKKSMIREYESQFLLHIRNSFKQSNSVNVVSPIEAPTVILYASFQEKQDGLKFIEQIQQHCLKKQVLSIVNDEQLITLTFNRAVEVQITWKDSNHMEDAIMSLLKSPLELVEQAIITLQNQIDVLREECLRGDDIISEEKVLNF